MLSKFLSFLVKLIFVGLNLAICGILVYGIMTDYKGIISAFVEFIKNPDFKYCFIFAVSISAVVSITILVFSLIFKTIVKTFKKDN